MSVVALIGVGTMGEAILSGLIAAGWPVDQLIAVESREDRVRELAQRYGVRCVSAEQVVSIADVIVISVKPQDAAGLLGHISSQISPTTLVVSICAGLPTGFFAQRLPAGTAVVRVMPNTPALVSEGMSAISAGDHATAEHLDLVERIFQTIGRTVRVPEYQQDAVTALSGSGPAYFFYIVDAMIEAGVLLGLSRQVARDLVIQTALGSAVMLRDSGEHPVVLREAVTSPAGTTAAAMKQLDIHGVRAALLAAAEAACDRARQLGH